MTMMFFLLLACAGPGNAPDDTGNIHACAEAPVLTWENFGEGFLRENCQACHASSAPFRETSPSPPPPYIHFDTKASALELREAILASATGTSPRMPPQGGPSADARERLRLWLTCWETEP